VRRKSGAQEALAQKNCRAGVNAIAQGVAARTRMPLSLP